jgi:hypothetical protein
MRILLTASLVLGSLAGNATAADTQEAHPQPFIFRYPTPPAGFKPLTASDEDLAKYGLPARPNPFARSTVPYASWARAMSAAHTRIEPLVRATGRRHSPALRAARLLSRQAGALQSTNWAGQTILNPVTSFGATSYTEILGQWVVSAVQEAIGTCGGTDVSATWIGIDGSNGSSDVLQAGTEADASCNNSNYYAWFEWYPGDEYEITNFASYPGAPIFVVVQATSATTGTATFVNLQSNEYTTVGIAAPAGTRLTGNTAEWIVERPASGNNNKLGNLADYGMIWISSEVAYLANEVGTGSYDVPGNPGGNRISYTYTMFDDNGNVLANSFPQGPSAQDLNVSGPAYQN